MRRPSAKPEPLPVEQEPAAAPRPARLVNEQYFEELDQAFSTLSAPKMPVREPVAEPATDAIDWFSRPAPAEPPPVHHAAPAPAAVAAAPSARAESAPPAATFPPLADAFTALLAAEQVSPAAAVAPAWPAAGQSPDVVDEVTRRVLEQMSDRTIRETVAGIVSQVAERLVREEIERIKNSISKS